MMFNFDDVLNNTSVGGARVVGEQHDTGKIAVDEAAIDAAMRGLGGSRGWDAREYGITAEQAAAELRAAQTPEARERVIADLKARALRRANLDTSTGKVSMMSAGGIVPWHGLGVVLDRNATGAEALKFASLDWEVEVVPAWYQFNGEYRKSTNARSVIRKDNGFELGSVGTKYTAFVNREGFEFGDAMLGLNGAHWETAGAIGGGQRVWGLVKFDCVVEPVPGDITEPYGLLTWTHDGSGMIRFIPTATRVECANTTRIALLNGRGKGFGVKHTKNVKARLKDAARALGFAKDSFAKYGEACEELVRKPLEVKHYANDVLDAVLNISEADVIAGPLLDKVLHVTQHERELAQKSFDRKVKNRKEVLSDILERYESERCHPKGSAYAAFNAITESTDHGKLGGRYKGTSLDRRERRFENVLIGRGDDVKQVALEKALA